MLPHSNSCSFSFRYGHSGAACLSLSSSSPTLYNSFNIVFQKTHSAHGVKNPICLPFFLFYVGLSSSPWLCVIRLHFSHDRSDWSSISFSSTTFQNFQVISGLLSEVSKFQDCPELLSQYRISHISAWDIGPFCYWRVISSCWMLLLHGNSWFNFVSTFCFVIGLAEYL